MRVTIRERRVLCFLGSVVCRLEYFKFDKESRAFEGRRATRRYDLGRLLVNEPKTSITECTGRRGSPGRTSAKSAPPE